MEPSFWRALKVGLPISMVIWAIILYLTAKLLLGVK